MGVFDKYLLGRQESESIIEMVTECDMVGRRIYFSNLFYHTDTIDSKGDVIYIKKEILYLLIPHQLCNYYDIIYSIDGVETKNCDRQVISIIYLKLQDYVEKYNS